MSRNCFLSEKRDTQTQALTTAYEASIIPSFGYRFQKTVPTKFRTMCRAIYWKTFKALS